MFKEKQAPTDHIVEDEATTKEKRDDSSSLRMKTRKNDEDRNPTKRVPPSVKEVY